MPQQPGFELIPRQRFVIEIPLGPLATDVQQERHLLLFLHALGDHVNAQLPGHGNDIPDDDLILFPQHLMVDKGSVDLDLAGREIPQEAQG